jgi:hypothetical protein
MDGTMSEQRLHTKKVKVQKVNTAKIQTDRSCKNLLTQLSHFLHLHTRTAVFTIYEKIIVKNWCSTSTCSRYTNPELTDMVFIYGEGLSNAETARRLYMERYSDRQLQDLVVFWTWSLELGA